MTMITPSYLGETIEYSSLHACRSTLEDPTPREALRLVQLLDRRQAQLDAAARPSVPDSNLASNSGSEPASTPLPSQERAS